MFTLLAFVSGHRHPVRTAHYLVVYKDGSWAKLHFDLNGTEWTNEECIEIPINEILAWSEVMIPFNNLRLNLVGL